MRFENDFDDYDDGIQERMLTGEEAEAVYFANRDFYSDRSVNYGCAEDPESDPFNNDEMTDEEFQEHQLRMGLDPDFILKNRPYSREA